MVVELAAVNPCGDLVAVRALSGFFFGGGVGRRAVGLAVASVMRVVGI